MSVTGSAMNITEEVDPLPPVDPRVVAAWENCYLSVLSHPYPSDGLYCNATWDGWGCWNYTKAGHRAYAQCPSFIEGFDESLHAFKDCTEEGWWKHPISNRSWSNYTTCVNTEHLEMNTRVIYVYISGYAVSIAALLLSLAIFFYFRQLACDRITIHKNLFISYILSGISWILYYTLAALNVPVLETNPGWCQLIHIITQYFVACNFFWMFCEGFYLHTIIVVAFTKGKKLLIACFVIGWCAPFFTTVLYTAIRATKADESQQCWLTESHLQWIIFAPIIITILLNFAFLLNIIRVLITKLRAVNCPSTNQSRKAARATLTLIPLLGVQYLLFPFRPEDDSLLLSVYLIASAIVTSFQGFFVAVIFCFLNGEVLAILKRRWGQHQLMTRGRSKSMSYTTHTTFTMADTNQYEMSNGHKGQTSQM